MSNMEFTFKPGEYVLSTKAVKGESSPYTELTALIEFLAFMKEQGVNADCIGLLADYIREQQDEAPAIETVVTVTAPAAFAKYDASTRYVREGRA